MVSADLLGTVQEDWKSAQADGFLSKPVDQDELLAPLATLLRLEYVYAVPVAAGRAKPVVYGWPKLAKTYQDSCCERGKNCRQRRFGVPALAGQTSKPAKAGTPNLPHPSSAFVKPNRLPCNVLRPTSALRDIQTAGFAPPVLPAGRRGGGFFQC